MLEWSYFGGSDQYEVLDSDYNLDQILLLQRENHGYLVLRMDSTVLRVDYRGSKDLSDYLGRFAQMLKDL